MKAIQLLSICALFFVGSMATAQNWPVPTDTEKALYMAERYAEAMQLPDDGMFRSFVDIRMKYYPQELALRQLGGETMWEDIEAIRTIRDNEILILVGQSEFDEYRLYQDKYRQML